MRELKFRAWDKKQKKMLYGVSIGTIKVWDENEPLISHEFSYSEDCIFEQYTGLKDKNGKEIYEGDIMRFDAIDYEICWSGDFSGWHNRRTDKGERVYGSNSFDEVTRFGSVIGNIHENKELLGEEE